MYFAFGLLMIITIPLIFMIQAPKFGDSKKKE